MVGGHGHGHGIRAAAGHLPARAHRGRARRLLPRQLETIAAGGDPINVSHDASAPPVVFEAGNFLREG
jgi:hypothetical protein